MWTISSPFLPLTPSQKLYRYFSVCSNMYRLNRGGISFFFSVSPSAENNARHDYRYDFCREKATLILSSHSLAAPRPIRSRKVLQLGMSAIISWTSKSQKYVVEEGSAVLRRYCRYGGMQPGRGWCQARPGKMAAIADTALIGGTREFVVAWLNGSCRQTGLIDWFNFGSRRWDSQIDQMVRSNFGRHRHLNIFHIGTIYSISSSSSF